MLSDIIHNNFIILPNRLALLHPELTLKVANLIPNDKQEDNLRLYSTENGLLTSKDAYNHCKSRSHNSDWDRII